MQFGYTNLHICTSIKSSFFSPPSHISEILIEKTDDSVQNSSCDKNRREWGILGNLMDGMMEGDSMNRDLNEVFLALNS